MPERCCGHGPEHHGQERAFYECDNSKREVCLACPGYEEPGYPNVKAWHRFKNATGPLPDGRSDGGTK